jgi:ferrous iron transport protein A
VIHTIASEKRLLEAKPGAEGVIARYTNEQIGSKLMAMGLLPGSRIAIVRKAPLGGGWYIKANGFFLALRDEEAASIVLK